MSHRISLFQESLYDQCHMTTKFLRCRKFINHLAEYMQRRDIKYYGQKPNKTNIIPMRKTFLRVSQDLDSLYSFNVEEISCLTPIIKMVVDSKFYNRCGFFTVGHK